MATSQGINVRLQSRIPARREWYTNVNCFDGIVGDTAWWIFFYWCSCAGVGPAIFRSLRGCLLRFIPPVYSQHTSESCSDRKRIQEKGVFDRAGKGWIQEQDLATKEGRQQWYVNRSKHRINKFFFIRPSGSPDKIVITDPNDARFDLEALLKATAGETAK